MQLRCADSSGLSFDGLYTTELAIPLVFQWPKANNMSLAQIDPEIVRATPAVATAGSLRHHADVQWFVGSCATLLSQATLTATAPAG